MVTGDFSIESWHILGDRLIPLAPLSLVGFDECNSLTFSRKVFPKGCHGMNDQIALHQFCWVDDLELEPDFI